MQKLNFKAKWLSVAGLSATALGGLLAARLVTAAPAADVAKVPAFKADEVKFFEEKVRPVLVESCIKCHGGEKTKGELKLNTREGFIAGGETGPSVVLDHVEKSLLLDAVNYKGDVEMPPKQKLPQEQIDAMAQWVKMGMPWTPGLDLAAGVKKPEAELAAHKGPPTVEEGKSFWAYVPPKRPDAPAVKGKDWVRNPVDQFVLAKLEAKGLTPAPAAEKAALLRRAYYDLTGLPPSPAEVDAYLADDSPDAYERVVDKLLASPQYGEKWGRHWLDLVRYGESNSYERDSPKPNAWRFRDYVIRSFNDDKPYDRFVKEQLAGDEMPGADTTPDLLIATGYYRLGVWDDAPPDRLQARYEGLDDIVATTSQVFLGMTIDCARCHDHKIDPIPQTDYYQLLSFFHNVRDYQNAGPNVERPIITNIADKAIYEQQQKELRERREQADALINEVHEEFRLLIDGEKKWTGEQLANLGQLIATEGERVLGPERYARYRQLRKDRASLERIKGNSAMALCVTENGSAAPETFVLVRGNASAPSQKVEPGFPKVLGAPAPSIAKPEPGQKSSGRRTALANYIASADNPLFARVMANRIWQYHFGRGIVRSANDFGYQGDRPTHPELLDWLATELAGNGWRLKPLHKLLMTSSIYRTSSTAEKAVADKAAMVDPTNDLLWRFDLRRLSAEEVRDSMLALNGTLNLKMFGPSVMPVISKEVLAGQSRPGENWKVSTPEEAARRSVYVHIKRSLRLPIAESFDAADADKSCPVRFVTVQPTQALGGINSDFFHEEAEKLARRLKREAGDDSKKQVELAMRLANSRPPTPAQVTRGVELIDGLQKNDGATPDAALKYFCLVVLNLNEFMYVD